MDAKYHFSQAIIREAGAYIRQHLSDQLIIEEKSDFTDLVTNLDREIQERLAGQILETYPDDLIYGEESEARPDLTDRSVWVIDPIDGTVNFVAQQTDFAILLSYLEEGQGQFALIYDVMADKLYHGGGRYPVYCNDQELPPYEPKEMKQSLVALNGHLLQQESLDSLVSHCLGVRSYGSAGISMSYILSGRLMAYLSNLYPWDYLSGKILGEALGYRVVTLEGKEPDLQHRQLVMMAPQAHLDQMITLIKT